jgi:hypothetical protein
MEQRPVYNVFCATLSMIRASLVDPRALYGNLENKQTFPVIWDSGASLSLLYDRNDFAGPLEPPPDRFKLKGIAAGLRMTGVGFILYTFGGSTGMLRSIKTPGILCPEANVKLT